MIIEFRVKNHRCFRDEQVLSMVAGPDKSLPDNVLTEDKFRLLRSAAIYGPNASGKSSLIEALGFMRDFVADSARSQPGDPIAVNPHRLDPASAQEPSLFELTFLVNGLRYQYGFTATRQRVVEEWLYSYPTNKAREWFRREWDEQAGKPKYVFPSQNLKGRKQEIADEAGENRLFLSWAASRNHEQLLPIYEWFRTGFRELPQKDFLRPVTAHMAFSDEETRKSVVQILRNADFGISDIQITEKKLDESRLGDLPQVKDLGEKERSELIDAVKAEWDSNRRFDVQLTHRGIRDIMSSFNLKQESDGTQRFFSLIGPWIEALARGYTVFVDEIHASLHPMLTRQLIELFHDPEWNHRGAQLILTTHDVSLIDSSLFRRDQIWLTEKDGEGAAHLYSLNDYKKPRKGENWRKGYMAGRYGAVPILGDFDKS
jgi:hypothetical protein